MGVEARPLPQARRLRVFGTFIPATGEVLIATYTSRSLLAFVVDFLEKVEAWVPDSVGRIYAIVDNLRTHRDARGA